jgi:hypothetical protein
VHAEKKPEAVAVAKFLRSQDLKTRVCILDGQRKDMFKGKRLAPDCIGSAETDCTQIV